MNDILKKKLASYSVATTALLAANHFSSEAQIIYTNIPDTSGLQTNSQGWLFSHYGLDLNNDGIADFDIFSELLTYIIYGSQGGVVSVKPENSSGAIQLAYVVFAEKLDCGQIINSQANMQCESEVLTQLYQNGSTGASETWGLWDDNAPHLLGLRFKVGSDTLYGWVRLQVANYGEFEVYDYAYNSTPNQEIAACDTSSFGTSVSITNEEQSTITAFVNADDLTAIVSINLLPTMLRVTNIMGQPIVSKEIIDEKNEINLSTFPAGIYLVTIGNGKSPWSRKIVLSR